MSALWQVLLLWRGRAGVLGFGLVVSLVSLLAGVALLAGAGGLIVGVLTASAVVTPLALRVLGPMRVGLRYAERMLTHDATFRALADLRVWFFRGLAERSAGGLGFRRAGDVLSRLVLDVEALDGLYLRILVPAAGAVVLLLALCGVVGTIDPALAWGVGALFAVAAFLLPLVAGRAVAVGGARLAEAAAGLRVAVLDALGGLREVRAFGAEGRMVALMQAREAALLDAQRAQSRAGARAGACALICTQGGVLLVLLWASSRGPAMAATTCTVAFFAIAAFEAIALLPRAGVLGGRAAAAAHRVLEAASGPVALAGPARPAALPKGHGLAFEGVGFRWQADRPEVFDGLTLDIPQGARVALLGPSGVGKSTLAALALKVVAPQRGRVTLGGVDLVTLDAAGVRARIGWLSQTTHLFADTIRANLLLARSEASDAELWEALDAARIGEVVRGLPGGLDALVGEDGTGVSGGQGRRLALARALLADTPVLILDEPGAGLDADTERAFLATLNDVAPGRTIVLIAHRLTGVERLDRIYRLSAGRAVAAAA